jgi:tetratricopeptide (TPR) repeat protein
LTSFFRQNQFTEALELFRGSIRIRKALLGEDDALVGDVYLAMGVLYDKMQSYDEAMCALEECMRIRSKLPTGNALPLAMVLTHIGIVHGNRSDFSAALSCWDDALALYKQCGLPDEDPAIMAVQSHKVKAKEMLEKIMFRIVLH